jgi:hypothetical protein
MQQLHPPLGPSRSASPAPPPPWLLKLTDLAVLLERHRICLHLDVVASSTPCAAAPPVDHVVLRAAYALDDMRTLSPFLLVMMHRCCVVCGVWCVVCGVWCVVCGVWCVVCGVWCVVCGVWCVVCGVWCVVCGVWCVVCGVWCVVCGVMRLMSVFRIEVRPLTISSQGLRPAVRSFRSYQARSSLHRHYVI